MLYPLSYATFQKTYQKHKNNAKTMQNKKCREYMINSELYESALIMTIAVASVPSEKLKTKKATHNLTRATAISVSISFQATKKKLKNKRKPKEKPYKTETNDMKMSEVVQG